MIASASIADDSFLHDGGSIFLELVRDGEVLGEDSSKTSLACIRVQFEGSVHVRSGQNRGSCELDFEFFKRVLGFVRPFKGDVLLEGSVDGFSDFRASRDEVAVVSYEAHEGSYFG